MIGNTLVIHKWWGTINRRTRHRKLGCWYWKPSRTKVASKRAPRKPNAKSVSVENKPVYLDEYAPPESRTQATPEAKVAHKIKQKTNTKKNKQKATIIEQPSISHNDETIIEPKLKAKQKESQMVKAYYVPTISQNEASNADEATSS